MEYSKGCAQRKFAFFTIRHVDDTTGVVTWTGVCIEMLDFLAEAFNFNYRVVEPADGQWGGVDDNGSWTGIVADVQSKRAFFAPAPVTVTAQRAEAVDFLTPYWESAFTFIVKAPEESKITRIFQPFTLELWIWILSACLFSSVIFWSFGKVSTKLSNCTVTQRPISVPGALDKAFRPIFMQSWFSLPVGSASSVYGGLWFFTCAIMLAHFACALMAHLTVSRQALSVAYIQDILDKPGFRAGAVTGYASTLILKDSPPDQPLGKLWQRIVDTNGILPSAPDYHKIDWNNFAFLADTTEAQIFVGENCDFAMGKERFIKANYGFPVAKDFPFKEEFNNKIRSVVEMGLIKKWVTKYSKPGQCAFSRTITGAYAITLEDISGLMILLAVGVALSTCVLLFEVFGANIFITLYGIALAWKHLRSSILSPISNVGK